MHPDVSRDDFRRLVGGFPSGVTIVTTRHADGSKHGFTATAFSSLSLQPPLVLVCLDAKADCHPVFQGAEAMAISILATGQSAVAMRFASKGIDKFEGVPTVAGERTGLPLIDGAAVHLECVMHERYVAGDHTVLIGRVVGGHRTDGEPLLYHGRSFGRFHAE